MEEFNKLMNYTQCQFSNKTTVVDGNCLASIGLEYIEKRIKDLLYKYSYFNKPILPPKLLIIDISGNNASDSYIRNIIKKCDQIGIKYDHIKFIKSFTKSKNPEHLIQQVLQTLLKIQSKEHASVIIPTPINWNYWFEDIDSDYYTKELLKTIESRISPIDDVDGISIYNTGHLVSYNDAPNIPATALAIDFLLKCYNINVEHKTVTVIGRSNTVGKPVAHLMLNNNATVTICSSFTPKETLDNLIRNSDIVISCAGSKEYLITADNVKPNSVIIDASYTVTNGKIHGDCDFDNVVDKVQLITPVPKGVGPITTCMLLFNVFNSWCFRTNLYKL